MTSTDRQIPKHDKDMTSEQKHIIERIHNAMSKGQDALALKVLQDFVNDVTYKPTTNKLSKNVKLVDTDEQKLRKQIEKEWCDETGILRNVK